MTLGVLYSADSAAVLSLFQGGLVRVVSGIPIRKENECQNGDALFGYWG
jgi:hypothetical protein